MEKEVVNFKINTRKKTKNFWTIKTIIVAVKKDLIVK